MSHWKSISRNLIFLAAIPCLAPLCLSQQSQPAATPAPSTKPAAAPAAHDPKSTDGQRAWEQNCSRCHNAPQGFSPHISGTVVMHMRARASLSEKDEQNILRFLNP